MIQDIKSFLSRYPKIEHIARKTIAALPYTKRLGKPFWEWYAFFEESQNWSVSTLQDYQLEHLQWLISTLLKQSTYYQMIFNDINIKSISSLSQLTSSVPTISRNEFRSNYSRILSTSWRDQHPIMVSTSGTTGNSLQFFHAREDQAREWAAICHQWKRVGFDPVRSRRAEFRGLTQPNTVVEYFPDHNYIRCSILHFAKSYITQYAEVIKKNKIEFFHGYPSALYLLAKGIQENKIHFPQPTAILFASEMVYDWQIEKIQQAFPSARLFAHYGCAERTVLASWCETSRNYHVMPQYSLVEVDPQNFEVIGTNLFNTINGFVRYRMNDTILDTTMEICPDCHRHYIPRFSKLGGRLEDYLYSPENGWIPPAVVTYPLKSLKTIEDIQILQKETDSITIRYIPIPNNTEVLLDNDLQQIQLGMNELLGKGMSIQFERVDDIPRTSSGKFRWIICELDEMPRGGV